MPLLYVQNNFYSFWELSIHFFFQFFYWGFDHLSLIFKCWYLYVVHQSVVFLLDDVFLTCIKKNFFFCLWLFSNHSLKKSVFFFKVKRNSSLLSSSSCTVCLFFTLRSLIHLEFTFMEGKRYISHLILSFFSKMATQLSLHYLFWIPTPHKILLDFASKS